MDIFNSVLKFVQQFKNDEWMTKSWKSTFVVMAEKTACCRKDCSIHYGEDTASNFLHSWWNSLLTVSQHSPYFVVVGQGKTTDFESFVARLSLIHADNFKINYNGPPGYGDLGKKARDVFGTGYHFGLVKLDLKTKSASGVEFSSGITSNQESGKVFGSLQSKYKVSDYGLTFTEKWNTDNTLATDITIQDQLVKGLKVGLDATFAPSTGSKSGKLKTSFNNEAVAVNCDLDLDLAGPIVNTSVVLKYQGWLAGYLTQFDSQNTKITKNHFALGYSTDDFVLHTNIDNGSDFGGSIYQKVSEQLDCGISMNWSSGSADTKFGVGAKYNLDQNASLRAKVNNASQIGLGYQQKLRDGVTLTLSALIDGQNFNDGGHKLGLALELEP